MTALLPRAAFVLLVTIPLAQANAASDLLIDFDNLAELDSNKFISTEATDLATEWSQHGGINQSAGLRAPRDGVRRTIYLIDPVDGQLATGSTLIQIAFKARVAEGADGKGAAAYVRVGISDQQKSTLFSGSETYFAIGVDAADPESNSTASQVVLEYRDPILGEKPTRTLPISSPVTLENDAWYMLQAKIEDWKSPSIEVVVTLTPLENRGKKLAEEIVTIPAENLRNLLDAPKHYLGFSNAAIFGGGSKFLDNVGIKSLPK